tara:strand:+ start:16035 stop:17021 length:987 start_codon:yes stop_codon:yes gene_type:complete
MLGSIATLLSTTSSNSAYPGDIAFLRLLGWLMREEPADVPAALRDALDHQRVREHRLVGLAFATGLDEFRDDFIRIALSAELWKKALAEVLHAFDAAGIDACRLKGCAYFLEVYEDPAHRSMSDLDILVRPEAFDEACKVLEQLGYATRTSKDFAHAPTHHALTFDRGHLTVDLHRNMMQQGRSQIDIDGIWERANLADHRPAPLDEIALHIGHVVRSELMVPLATFVDLARLMRQSNCGRQAILAHCDAFRFGRGARLVLAMHDLLREGRAGRAGPYPLPSVIELVHGQAFPRLRTLLIKTILVQGPRELVGLARTTLLERSRRWQS